MVGKDSAASFLCQAAVKGTRAGPEKWWTDGVVMVGAPETQRADTIEVQNYKVSKGKTQRRFFSYSVTTTEQDLAW